MNYQEALDYIEGLAVFGVKLGLTRIERLLELLGQFVKIVTNYEELLNA